MWHGLAPFCFKDHVHITLDSIFLSLIVLIYVAIHVILLIWMRSAYSQRHELNEKDKLLYEQKQREQQSSSFTRKNKSITPYQSHYNLIAEVDEKNTQYHNNLNQKRQSIFNMAANIDDFENMKFSKKRRLSTKVKDFFISNVNLSTANSNTSNLNMSKVAPTDKT
jgi:hypothetical protein